MALSAIGVSCGGFQATDSSGEAGKAPASDKGQSEARSADELFEENFNEGPELPEGWPTELIPLPAGAAAIASLSKTSIPGSPGPTAAVLYSTPQSPEEIQSFLARELPKKGWTLLESSPPGETMTTAAQGNGYLGIFSSGAEAEPSEEKGIGAIKMQIILAEIPK